MPGRAVPPAEVILTHNGADFDGLASMVCARKLYPGAALMLVGSPDPSVREFLATYGEVFPVQNARAVDKLPLRRVVLVDVQVPSRLGEFRTVVSDPAIEVHIFDHHPPTQESIQGDLHCIEEVGATTTMLVERLAAHRIGEATAPPEITPLEATLFALGIYEETGSLCFVGTTPRDVRAAAWLLERGANLEMISHYINRALGDAQGQLLNDLLATLETREEKGMRVQIATASASEYVGEAAVVVHRLMDLQRPDALFCLLRMKHRIYVVGRSRQFGPDVGALLQRMGGGGHQHAASASLRHDDLDAARSELLDLLERHAVPPMVVRDIMSTPVQVIELEPRWPSAAARESHADLHAEPPVEEVALVTMEDAAALFARYSHTVLPVVRSGKLVGMLSRRDVDKAQQHLLNSSPVTEFAGRPVITVTPKTSVLELQRLFTHDQSARIPVIEENRVVGMVTRRDLLEALHQTSLAPEPESVEGLRVLPRLLQELLRTAGRVGDDLEVGVYAVGGFVRDVLLKVENLDVDLVVEGDGIAYAEKLAQRLGGRCRPHEKFGTAVVVGEHGLKVDVASSRLEFYTRPAALPDVTGSSLKQDLFRRDFTVNAMAIQLNVSEHGRLFDFFGGQRDLRERVIRVLHNLSFIDDPTRIFRAIKFEQRYHFHMEPHTEQLLRQAISASVLEQVSPKRIRDEFLQILGEARPVPGILRMDQLRVLRLIHRGLHITPRVRAQLDDITAMLAQFEKLIAEEGIERWIVWFRALAGSLTEDEIRDVAYRFHIGVQSRRRMFLERGHVRHVIRRLFRRNLLPSEVYSLLTPLSLEMVLYLLARAKARSIKERILLFLNRLRKMKPMVSGHILKEWGMEPGPEVGATLWKLTSAQLDGKIHDLEEARAYLEEEDIIADWT